MQDVVQFGPMARTLFGQVLDDPGFVPQIFSHVGIPPMLDWARHFVALGSYTLLDKVGCGHICIADHERKCLKQIPHSGSRAGSIHSGLGQMLCGFGSYPLLDRASA